LPRRPRGNTSSTENQLESGIALNERLSKLSGWAVLAGLGIEIVLASVYHDHASFIENWGPVFATALITLGVFGEIHFAGRVSKSEERLRQISEEKVADAASNAARAILRARALEKEAADARERTAEIERLTQWRRISREQYDTIFSELRFKLDLEITIECVFDPEAIMYADQFKELFLNARANHVVRLAKRMPPNGRLEYGLSIASEPEIYATTVREAFQKAGLELTQMVLTPGGPPRMTLYVGYRKL
jgi:hypothetical protein